MRAQNKVVAGDYKDYNVKIDNKKPYISQGGFSPKIFLNSYTVKACENLNEEHQKSVSSGVARGIAGGLIFGGLGMVAGSVSGKTRGVYQIAVEFSDGKKSLLEVDETIHSALIAQCFAGSAEPKAVETAKSSENKPPKLLRIGGDICLVLGIIVIIVGFLVKYLSIPCSIIGTYLMARGIKASSKKPTCRKCRNKIGYEVKVCPYCGAKDSYPLWLTALTLLFGGILTFIAVLVTISK